MRAKPAATLWCWFFFFFKPHTDRGQGTQAEWKWGVEAIVVTRCNYFWGQHHPRPVYAEVIPTEFNGSGSELTVVRIAVLSIQASNR